MTPAAFSHKTLLFSSQSISKTCIGMLTTVVGIPKAYGFTTTPARITGSIGSTPLRDTILLGSRNNLKVLLHDELPDGMYYEWKLLEANGGDETFQPQPSNDKVCYIGLNGNTDVLRFSVTTRTASGFQGIVAERVFTFLFFPNRL